MNAFDAHVFQFTVFPRGETPEMLVIHCRFRLVKGDIGKLFALHRGFPTHKTHPRQNELPVERAGGKLDEQFAGGGEEDFGAVVVDSAGGFGFSQCGIDMEAADDLDLAGIVGGLGFVLCAEAGGKREPPFGAGFVGVVPDEFGVEPDGAVGAGIGAGVEFDFRQAVADELQGGFHGIRNQIRAGDPGSEKAKVCVLRPAGRRLK